MEPSTVPLCLRPYESQSNSARVGSGAGGSCVGVLLSLRSGSNPRSTSRPIRRHVQFSPLGSTIPAPAGYCSRPQGRRCAAARASRHPEQQACPARYSSSTVLPTPGSPRMTRTGLRPARTASTTLSSVSRSAARPVSPFTPARSARRAARAWASHVLPARRSGHLRTQRKG